MYFLTCFSFQIQVPNYSTVLNFWQKKLTFASRAMFDIQYLMSEWHDKGAILPSGLKHVLKQGMKILGVSVNWKWDRLVTYWLTLVLQFNASWFSLQAHNVRRVTQLQTFMKNKKEDLEKKQRVWEARFQKRSSEQARKEHEDSLKFFQVSDFFSIFWFLKIFFKAICLNT